MFPIGEPNPYGEFFVGQSYLAPVSSEQMLICVGGRGYYQEWGKEPVKMTPGTVINIPAEVKHWHGAAPDSWFAHLAIEIKGDDANTQWCEKVSDEDYKKL